LPWKREVISKAVSGVFSYTVTDGSTSPAYVHRKAGAAKRREGKQEEEKACHTP
jgi:hypothetical protein